ncbi:hypothetical protein [Burkholderia sp. Ac-20379]|uniref:hypothetical protein n=1 Tax=Burkholderia sp. Ac-20379 TaxID=2703900 RepID=UPI00197CB640|nr:hypothetical protein [Burkholderia sp. Ac-20379]MBN3724626.1 hypothetical protein [Burkholderia sp. Ac-20379]
MLFLTGELAREDSARIRRNFSSNELIDRIICYLSRKLLDFIRTSFESESLRGAAILQG